MSTYFQHFSHHHVLEFGLARRFLRIEGLQYSLKTNCALCQLSVLIDDDSYCCPKCLYFIHKKCAELPQHIDHPLHPHHNPLRLNKRSSNDTSTCYYCENPFQNQYLAYKCDQCSLQMHIICASIPIPTIKFDRNKDSDVAQYVCHQNPMTLVENDNCKSQAKCFACQSFWSGQAYSCTSAICKNFLHKSCAELPWKIQHPFHVQHPLTLQVSKPQSCSLCCKKDCRLLFSCHSGCNFNLDTECAFVKTTVKCHSHDHLLSFVEKAFCDIQCDACQKSYTKWNDHRVPDEVNRTQSLLFRCMECNFNLHFLCGPLPPVIRYEYHLHLLMLVDHFMIKDNSNAHYCDICEEERNPSFRVYYCKDCKYAAHIYCLFSEIMKVIKGNSNNVELISLGENVWYQFGTKKEMLEEIVRVGEKDLTFREVMNSLTEEEKEKLIDPIAFGRPSSFRTKINERYNYYRRENSPLFDRELRSIPDIDQINRISRFRGVEVSNIVMVLEYYRPREGLKLDEKYLRQKVVDVEGYMVPIMVAPILKRLLPDLQGLSCSTNAMKSVIATLICIVADRMWKTKFEDITKDDVQNWVFCLDAIKRITNFGISRLDATLNRIIMPSFIGFEAIRYEKDISEKLDHKIANLEAELESWKEVRKMFKTETSKRPEAMKDNLIKLALKLKGKNLYELESSNP